MSGRFQVTTNTAYLPPKMRAHLEAVLRKLGFIGKKPKGRLRNRMASKGQCDAADEIVGWCDLSAGHGGRHGRVCEGGGWATFGEEG